MSLISVKPIDEIDAVKKPLSWLSANDDLK